MRKALILGLLFSFSLSAQAAGPYDGRWVGKRGDKDTGNCQGTGQEPKDHDLVIEDGRLRNYDFETRSGLLPLAGGVASDGSFRAEGNQPQKGKVVYVAKVEGNKLVGRWSFEVTVPGTSRLISCTGPFEFTKS